MQLSNSSKISDRKVIGHCCSTVPLNSPWCAFRIVQRHKHTFISLISDSLAKDITHFSLGEQMYSSVVQLQQLAQHVERQDTSAQVHHPDVSGQTDSVARKVRSTGHEPDSIQNQNGTKFMSIANGDDEDLTGNEKSQFEQTPSSINLEDHSNGTGRPGCSHSSCVTFAFPTLGCRQTSCPKSVECCAFLFRRTHWVLQAEQFTTPTEEQPLRGIGFLQAEPFLTRAEESSSFIVPETCSKSR